MSGFSTGRPSTAFGTTRVLHTPEIVKQQYISLIQTAVSEILLIFPTVNAVKREHQIGVIDELSNAVKRGVKIRILSAEDDFIKERLDQMRASGIIVKKIETPTETKFKLLIVDRTYSLVIETRDDSKKQFDEAIGTGILSNSKDTVAPYTTIFEILWRETDLYEKTREAEAVKDEFVKIAAHELRNPIMPAQEGTLMVQGLVERIKNKLSKEEYAELRAATDIVSRNVVRLAKLSEDILQVSRIESGTFSLNMQDSNVHRLDRILRSVISDVERKYSTKMGIVNIMYEPEKSITRPSASMNPLLVSCDESKIEQCMYNLLDNAVKFTTQGLVVVNISASPEEITIQIRDMGQGVDSEVGERLFEKFVTKSEGGTGLGLYVTKKIVEAHGGKIWAGNNQDGPGSTFGFAIPRNANEEIYSTTEPVTNFRIGDLEQGQFVRVKDDLK